MISVTAGNGGNTPLPPSALHGDTHLGTARIFSRKTTFASTLDMSNKLSNSPHPPSPLTGRGEPQSQRDTTATADGLTPPTASRTRGKADT